MTLELSPINQRNAKIFVNRYHRHHKAPVGSIFQIACRKDNEVVGVVIAGRPVARRLQDLRTLEVTRLCTDGTKNACSILYAAAWRAAKAMGYKRMITYILESEKGTSLLAAGWKYVGKSAGGSWNRKKRPRFDNHPIQPKKKFEIKAK